MTNGLTVFNLSAHVQFCESIFDLRDHLGAIRSLTVLHVSLIASSLHVRRDRLRRCSWLDAVRYARTPSYEFTDPTRER